MLSKVLANRLVNLLDTGELLEMVDSVLAGNQLLVKLGYKPTLDKYLPGIKQFLIDNDVDFSHWTKNGRPSAIVYNKVCLGCNMPFSVRGEKRKSQTTCSYSCASKVYRSGSRHPNYTDGSSNYRIKALQYYENKCCKCGYSNIDALEVHHIDKNRKNNEISNLEILCANCHVLTHKNSASVAQ